MVLYYIVLYDIIVIKFSLQMAFISITFLKNITKYK